MNGNIYIIQHSVEYKLILEVRWMVMQKVYKEENVCYDCNTVLSKSNSLSVCIIQHIMF